MFIRIDRNPPATRSFVLDLKNFEVIDPLKEGQVECIRDYEGIENYKVLNPSPLWIEIPAIRVCGRRFKFPSPAVDGYYSLFNKNRFYYFTFGEYDQEEGWKVSPNYHCILRVKFIPDGEDSPSIRVYKNKLEIDVFPIGETSPICKVYFDPIEGIKCPVDLKDMKKLFRLFSNSFLKRLYEKGFICDLDPSAYTFGCFSELFQIFNAKINGRDKIFIIREDSPVLIEFCNGFSPLEGEDFDLLKKYGVLTERYSKEVIMIRFENEDTLLFIPSRRLISNLAGKLECELEEDFAEHFFLHYTSLYRFDNDTFKKEFFQKLTRKILYHAKINDIYTYEEHEEEYISYKEFLAAGNCEEEVNAFYNKYGLGSMTVQVGWLIDNWEDFSTDEKIGILKVLNYKFRNSRLDYTILDFEDIPENKKDSSSEEDPKEIIENCKK